MTRPLRLPICFFATLVAVAHPLLADNSPAEVLYKNGAVAADHPLASEAGAEILRKGGNVVDAAVATSFTLSVVRPSSCGVGGGGFLVFWNAKQQQATTLDYREIAPSRATRDMFIEALKARPSEPFPSRNGGLAVAVPGTVAGLLHAHSEYGTLDLKTVLAPAIRLAREGVPVDEHMRAVQKTMLARFADHPDWTKRYAALYRLYLNEGRPWQAGDIFRSPQLQMLELIAEQGAAGFYKGPVAESLVQTVRESGGVLTADDLTDYRPRPRKPLHGTYGGAEVWTMPPPSSGGVALLETLHILSAYEIAHAESRLPALAHNSSDYAHLLTEAMKHAYADRAEFLGDPDFADVPVETLTSLRYAARLAERISPEQTFPPAHYGRFWLRDDAGTSHFSVMDAAGNAVACTETINTYFGSMVVDPRFGVVLNNQMDDFTAVPGEPNAFGLIQGEANSVAPGKKPLSSMTPTILVRDGKATLALGASGGPRIISTTIQVLLNVTAFDMPPEEAVALPRLHHQWLPNAIDIEPPLFDQVQASLSQRGHQVRRRANLAVCQVVQRTPQGLRAASDPRKHGAPAGW